MKYRRLSRAELKELENEFKQFLISNEIYDDQWRALNAKNDPKVLELVDIFSEIVIEKALKKIFFLEHVSKEGISYFHCMPLEMKVIGLTGKCHDIDFVSTPIENLINQGIKIFESTKTYRETREQEVFQLLEDGCSIIDEKNFRQIQLAYEYSLEKNRN